MQQYNDMETGRNERSGYMGSGHYYEAPFGQTFQQQTYYPPMSGSGPASYGQQPFAGTPPLSDSRFAAVLSYSFGWLTGLLFMLFGGQNRFVRFHALQSLAFFGAINVIDFGLFQFMFRVAHYFDGLLVVCILLCLLLNFIAFVSWIIAMVQAARGVYFRLPFVGDLVARCFGLNSPPHW